MISGVELTQDNSLLELLRSTKKSLKDAMDKTDPDLLASQLEAAAQEERNNSKKEMLAIANSSGSSMMSSNFASSGGTSDNIQSTRNVLAARRKITNEVHATVGSLLNSIEGIDFPEGLFEGTKHSSAWYKKMIKLVQTGKTWEASKEELKKTKKEIDERADQALVTTDENGIAINETQEALANPTASLPETSSVDVSVGTSANVSIETSGGSSPETTVTGTASAAPQAKSSKKPYKPIHIVV